ncbi:MAG: ligand-binding sensor domain-containing protein, partial [Bacteroidota bacterium]
IVEDKKNQLWIGTWIGGIIHYDSKNKHIINTFNRDSDAGELSGNMINAIHQSKNGINWFGTWNNGLNRYNPEQQTFKSYQHINKSGSPLSSNRITAINDGEKSNLWVGTDGEGIDILSYNNKEITHSENHRHSYSDPYSLSNNRIHSIYKDQSGIMWVGTASGLNKYAPNKQKISHYSYHPDINTTISSNNLTDVFEDLSGNIWITTWGGGLNHFNPKTGKAKIYTQKNSGLPENQLLGIKQYKKNVLWIAGRNSGLIKFKPQEESFKTIPIKSPSEKDYFLDFFIDSKGHIWLGTYRSGIYKYNPKKKEIKYPEEIAGGTFSNHEIMEINEDNNHNIWISTFNDGIYLINQNDSAHQLTKVKQTINNTNHIYQDQKNQIWAYTGVSKALIIDPENLTTKEFPHIINTIYEDRQGELWIGSKNGLLLYDHQDQSVFQYTTHDGLPDNEIYCIEEDANHHLWLSTNSGISRFNKQNEEFKNFNLSDGLKDLSFSKGISYQSKSGEMYFISESGINVWHPDSIKFNRHKPKVVFTEFYISNTPVKPGQKTHNQIILDQSITHTQKITLSHKADAFTLEFAVLDYYAPQKNEFIYKMNGFDDTWINTKKNNVTYTNLDPGKYTFMVKGYNNDGFGSETPATLEINILPPFYQTWWFRILAIIFIIGLFALLYLYRLTQVKFQNQKLNEQVKERTFELQLQKEELKKISASKDKLFAIVGQDLQKPFNKIVSIGHQIISNNEKQTGKTSLSKEEQIKQITDIAEGAKDHLENLMIWSEYNSRRIVYTPEHINLNQIIKENIRQFKSYAKDKSIKLYVENLDNLHAYADRHMVNIIAKNLINNAIKYTQAGGEVRVSFKVREDDECIDIRVSDTGVGMSKDVVEKLFSIEKEKNITEGTQGESGSGLGVLLVNDFVKENKGTIDVKSKPGKGSLFIVSLPYSSKTKETEEK